MPNDLSYQIEIPTRNDYPAIISVWEASVRATHDFLREEDIHTFKSLIRTQYLDAVQLHCIKLNDVIVAFLGTSAEKIEMLFADPNHHGKGLGKELLLYAIHTLKKKGVDVNEQNEKAVLFYNHFGFEVVNRSEKDGTGKHYPLLHMQLKK